MIDESTQVLVVLVKDTVNSIIGVRFKGKGGVVFDVAFKTLEEAGVNEFHLAKFHKDPVFSYAGRFVTEDELQLSLRVDEFNPTPEEAEELYEIILDQPY